MTRTPPPQSPSPMTPDPCRDGPGGSGELDVQVVPRAARSRVVGPHDGRLKIQLAAPPVDGAANAALVDLLADDLAVPRGDVAIVRGHTGRKKTVRVAGLSAAELRRRLGLASLLLVAACVNEVPFAVKVLVPDEEPTLERADNAALELTPGGASNFDVDGLDFSLEVSLEPDDTQRTLALYLAEGKKLLAWGRSAPFVLSSPTEGLAVFISPPGQLARFPGAIAEPDPELLVAVAPGRGAVMLDSAGHTALLNEFTLETDSGATLDAADLPAPDDGALVPDTGGGVWRLGWAGALRGYRYDPGGDAWTTGLFVGDELGPREHAAWLVDAALERVLVFGGGERSDIGQIDLRAETDGTHTVTLLDDPLDGPRRRARALYVTRADTDEGEGVVIVGGDDPARPLAYDVGRRLAFGPAAAWTGLQCAPLAAGPADEVRILCVGGLRDGTPSSAGLLLHFPAPAEDKDPSLELVADLIPEAPADPRLFADDASLYAQFAGPEGGTWRRIDRQDLTTEATPGPALRARGGHSVSLGTGATFLLGGWTADDHAVDRWHVFVPALPSE